MRWSRFRNTSAVPYCAAQLAGRVVWPPAAHSSSSSALPASGSSSLPSSGSSDTSSATAAMLAPPTAAATTAPATAAAAATALPAGFLETQSGAPHLQPPFRPLMYACAQEGGGGGNKQGGGQSESARVAGAGWKAPPAPRMRQDHSALAPPFHPAPTTPPLPVYPAQSILQPPIRPRCLLPISTLRPPTHAPRHSR